MKILLIIISMLLAALFTNAQQVVLKKHHITKGMQERFYVLKSDRRTKHGLYQVIYHKTALASGVYTNGKQTGIWHFYDYKQQVMENFSFDTRQVLYEAPEDSVSNFRYLFDKSFHDTDHVTKPIRIGGRYFGYLPYLRILKQPAGLIYLGKDIPIQLEILVSPGGNLADFMIHFPPIFYKEAFHVNINLLNADDKLFIPATINGEAVSSRIMITCYLDAQKGTLTL